MKDVAEQLNDIGIQVIGVTSVVTTHAAFSNRLTKVVDVLVFAYYPVVKCAILY